MRRLSLVGPLWDLLRPWKFRLMLVGLGIAAAAALDVIPSLIIGKVLDGLAAGHTTGLPVAAGACLAALAAVHALTAAYGYLAATVAQRALAALRTGLFEHLLALPTEYHDETPVGDAISRATADVDAIDDLFSSSTVVLIGETLRLATVTAAMLLLSPALTLAAAGVVPPVLLLTIHLRRRIRDAERATRSAVGRATTELQETLAGVHVVRAFARQAEFAGRFHAALSGWLRASNTSTRYNAFYAPGLAMCSAIATAGLLWAGGAVHLAAVSIGTLTAFVLLFARFFTPLINLGDEWQRVQAALSGAERVFHVLALPRAGQSGGPSAAGSVGPPVVMERVDFGYRPGQAVLHGIDVTVRAGEHVAIVGRSGAGKSSMLALVAGLYPPTHGSVRLAGHDPALLADDERRALVAVVPQTVHLFSGTVHDNVALGDDTITAEQLVAAARITGAHAFVAALPYGYQSILAGSGRGEGITLSAGQRQLLALTRALVSRPAVLLLDEATAVVDGASDAAIRTALSQLVQPNGTAILTVAHRLATARLADRIIVVAAGRIIEEGSPAVLARTDSHFASLLALEEAGWNWEDVDR
jgi:ABC-type multidrug transport system fused ATPase/permease subunit